MASAGLSSVLAGASRLCRLRSRLPPGRAAVAAGVLAPIATGFLLEALRLTGRAGHEAKNGTVVLQLGGPRVEVWAAMAAQLASGVGGEAVSA